MLEIYLVRWRCEETYHFMKQAYNLEDVPQVFLPI
ncbi:MAG: transposase [Desulfobacterales bacterium]|nr:transposase [Desulfobacterales bacterium]